MRISRRAAVSIGWLTLSAVGIAACGALAHPVSNEGNDANNPNGRNPGTPTLSLSADRTDLGVGDMQIITATYNGAVLNGGGATPTSTVSDPGVISGGAFSAHALSVGGATIAAAYQGSTATIGFTVHSQYGLTAIISAYTNALTGESAWLPSSVRVPAGSTVQFNIASTHNVVFDAVPGAPANITVGATGAAGIWRQFPTAAAFTFQCTVHGETGVINVTP
jgi:plastocyanin